MLHEYIVHSITKSNLLQHLTKTTVARHMNNLAISENTCPSDTDMHRATVDILFLSMRMHKISCQTRRAEYIVHSITESNFLQDYSRQTHKESCHLSKHMPPTTRVRPGQQKTHLNKKNSADLELQTRAGGLPQLDNFWVRP